MLAQFQTRRRLYSQMLVSSPGRYPSTRRALQEAELNQIWLVDVHDGVGFFAGRSCQRFNSDRPAIEFLDNRLQHPAIDFVETQAIDFEQLGITINVAHDANAGNVTGATIATAFNGTTAVTTASSSAIFRVGAEVGDDVALSFQDMRASALGSAGNKLSTLIADNSAVSTSAKADTLVTSIDEAIEQVSTFRAQLGAAQNQMETAVNSLAVSVENLSASESRIRDADIAQVSSELVAKQIMQQAGVSVLSQANTAPQAVLSLLQQ